MVPNLNDAQEKELTAKARTIRGHVLRMITQACSGHPGGSLSAADILTALYFHVMSVNPHDPASLERDRFVLSKGHAAPVLYATLAEKGYFSTEELTTFRRIDSRLQGHPDMKHIPGVDMSTGSLGQGLSAANGMALAAKLDGAGYRVYALLGDGELEEGQVWEAVMAAAHYKLDNVTAFVDYNGLQIDGKISEVMSSLPIADKFRAFGWNVLEIDGHDFKAIVSAVDAARQTAGRPTVIVAKTIKGKGISVMEGKVDWHGKAPSQQECLAMLSEL